MANGWLFVGSTYVTGTWGLEGVHLFVRPLQGRTESEWEEKRSGGGGTLSVFVSLSVFFTYSKVKTARPWPALKARSSLSLSISCDLSELPLHRTWRSLPHSELKNQRLSHPHASANWDRVRAFWFHKINCIPWQARAHCSGKVVHNTRVTSEYKEMGRTLIRTKDRVGQQEGQQCCSCLASWNHRFPHESLLHPTAKMLYFSQSDLPC